MYLKSLSIRNYRKFHDEETFEFAHSSWEQGIEGKKDDEKEKLTEKYISQSTSLLVGKNNAGKSTAIGLLNRLQSTKCGNKGVFKCNDFNLNYLHEWYNEHFVESSDNIDEISPEDLPFMQFELKVGIDDGNDIISSFKDILVISGLKKIEDNLNDDKIAKEAKEAEVAEVTIVIKYEVVNVEKFKQALKEIKRREKKRKEKIEEIKENNNEAKYEKIRQNEIKARISYYDGLSYREFLDLFSETYYALNFYPLGASEKADQFSLAPLLKVNVVEANTVKDSATLSKAYSKIVSTYAKNNKVDSIKTTINDLNSEVKGMVDSNVKGILQNAVTAVESTKNLQINLYPDVTLEKVLAHNIVYEYHENEDNIPEAQYGMGYTNLMVIIANIVDYLEVYKEDDINGAVNILCIEEPESFMHPQMQELFIKNIAKAISRLLGKKNEFDTFQILITTHSSHILNSKIQSGNSLDNIIYLGEANGQKIVKSIKDEYIIGVKEPQDAVYEYIKKYLRLEATDIFFADAIILVEGMSEETYLRYLIDAKELNIFHIKVYRIDGAHAHKFRKLLELLGVKTIILTDLDLKRKKEKNKDNKTIDDKANIKDLTNYYGHTKDCITTNNALRDFIIRAFDIFSNENDEKNSKINEEIISEISNNEFLKLTIPETNITVYSQGKINGSYATSFEEAIILTNSKPSEEGKESLRKLLFKKVGLHSCSNRKRENADFINDSYQYQLKLTKKKEKFSTGIVQLSIEDDNFKLNVPTYISLALEEIEQALVGDQHD